MAYQPIHNPQSVIGSVFTYPQANQSVSGTVGSSIIGQLPAGTAPIGSVVTLQGTNPWVIIGSIQGDLSATVSSASVVQQGTWRTSVISSTPSSMLTGASIFGQLPGGTATLGSITAIQGTNPYIFTGSVQGAVSVLGHAPVVIVGGSVATVTTNSSVMLLNGANVIGSVTTLQGTNPWVITGSIQGNLSATVSSASVVQEGTWRVSVLSSTPSSMLVGASIIGLTPVNVANFPAVQNVAFNNSSIVSYQLAGSVLATSATVTPAANQSVSGTVDVAQIGTHRVSVISSTPSSMLVGASVFGNVGISGIPDVNTAGSVVAFQSNPSVFQVLAGLMSTNASIITAGGTTGNSSVQVLNFPTTQNVSGSVVASGTITADQGIGFGSVAAHIKSGSIVAVLGGNTSVISANPQSSIISWNAPRASWVSGIADLRSNTGASVAVIGGQGGAIATYITGVQVANYGPSSVLVTLAGSPAGGSILGYTIAPAGGGSNVVYPNALKTGGNQPFTASINTVASVLISAQGFTV